MLQLAVTIESMTHLYVKLRLLEILDQWEAARNEVYSFRLPITAFVASPSFLKHQWSQQLAEQGWGSRRYLIMRTNYIFVSFPELIPRSVAWNEITMTPTKCQNGCF